MEKESKKKLMTSLSVTLKPGYYLQVVKYQTNYRLKVAKLS